MEIRLTHVSVLRAISFYFYMSKCKIPYIPLSGLLNMAYISGSIRAVKPTDRVGKLDHYVKSSGGGNSLESRYLWEALYLEIKLFSQEFSLFVYHKVLSLPCKLCISILYWTFCLTLFGLAKQICICKSESVSVKSLELEIS